MADTSGTKRADPSQYFGNRGYSLTPCDGSVAVDKPSVSDKMIKEIEAVGWGAVTLSPGIIDCHNNVLAAGRKAFEEEYGLQNTFKDNYLFDKSCIAGNWDSDILKGRKCRDTLTDDEYTQIASNLLVLKTNPYMNEFMLDYIKRCIDYRYPAIIGVTTGHLSLNKRELPLKVLTNDGVTSHFLILTSYVARCGRIISLHGFDNAEGIGKERRASQVTFFVDDKTVEMYKKAKPLSTSYTASRKYQITQVRMWEKIRHRDTDRAFHKHNWGSWGLNWWKLKE